MRKIFATTLLFATSIFCNAQNWELKINAGGNTTFVDDIKSGVAVRTQPKVPGVDLGAPGLTIAYSTLPDMDVKNEVGYYFDGELVRNLSQNWALSASLGLNKIGYSYNIELLDGATKVNISDLDQNYGKTRFLYLSSRFLNVTKSFSSLSLSAGPVISYLIHNKKFYNQFTTEIDANTISTLAVPQPAPSKFLYGGNLSLGYKLAEPLELKAGAQYFFNSIYKKGQNTTGVPPNEKDHKVNPFQLTLGLSYSIMKF